jgi:hypothetical protein
MVAFYPDGGRDIAWAYDELDRFVVRRGLMMRSLVLWTKDGSPMRFKVGRQLAANAKYILEAFGVTHA